MKGGYKMKIAIVTILIICIAKITWADTYEKGLLKASLYLGILNILCETVHAYSIYGLTEEPLKTLAINIIPIIATVLTTIYCKNKFAKLH